MQTQPSVVARQTGYSLEQWTEAQEVLGPWWERTWETVAHLTVLTDRPPATIARILVGGGGYPGLFPTAP